MSWKKHHCSMHRKTSKQVRCRVDPRRLGKLSPSDPSSIDPVFRSRTVAETSGIKSNVWQSNCWLAWKMPSRANYESSFCGSRFQPQQSNTQWSSRILHSWLCKLLLFVLSKYITLYEWCWMTYRLNKVTSHPTLRAETWWEGSVVSLHAWELSK